MEKFEFTRRPIGSFVFIDDSKAERLLFKEAMKHLGLKNKSHFLKDGQEAFQFLKNTKENIFLIVSDLNMPVMDGLQLKLLIELTPELKIKAIPFIFHTQVVSPVEVRAAYASNIQGYIRKAPNMEGTIRSLYKVISFWTDCIHPRDL